MNRWLIVWPSCLHQEDVDLGVFGQAVGEYAPCGPGTDDDVVVHACFLSCASSTSRHSESCSCVSPSKLPPDRPSCWDGSGCRQVQPTARPPHAGPCPSASSRRALAAGSGARRSGRGHRDRPLHQAPAPAVSSPEHSCLLHTSRFLLCRSPSPMDGCEPRWHPSAMAAIGGPRLHRVLAFPVPSLGNGSTVLGGIELL